MIRTVSISLASALWLTACAPSEPETEVAPVTPPEPPALEADIETPTDDAAGPVEPQTEVETVGYPDGWELQPYWSGEYPNAFSVTQEGVTVMGHEAITFGKYPPIYCGLPHKATYSPWNAARSESDDLEFVAMVFPTKFTIKEDVSIEAFLSDVVVTLSLKAGDELIYKNYLAEGFFIAEKDGEQYEMSEMDLPQSTEFEQGPEDQEWVRVTCDDADKTRAWVLYDDALKAPGVEVYEYISFGDAADLP